MYNTTDKILLRILAGKALEFKQSKWLLIIIKSHLVYEEGHYE